MLDGIEGSNVLIVDDAPENLRLLATVLTRGGLIPRPVPTGALAIEAALSDPPDLVLMDVGMPEMSGLDVCRWFKQDERLRSIPIIFISGHQGAEDKVEAFRVGGVDYVTKPFQEAEVLARIKTHLHLKKLQATLLSNAVELKQRVIEQGQEVTATQLEAARLAAQLQSAVGVAGLGLWRLQLATGKITATERLCQIAGVAGAAQLDQVDRLVAQIHPDDRIRVGEAVAAARVARPGQPVPQAMLLRWLHADGAVRWSDVSVEVTFDRSSRPEFLLGAALDVTDRIRERESLRALARRLQVVREEEKARIARDLHDDLGQALTRLQLELNGVERRIEALTPSAEVGILNDEVVAAAELVKAMVGQVQRIAMELRPAMLEGADLPALLRQEVRQFGLRAGLAVRIEVLEGCEQLSDDAATALFRIAQEALTNVVRHAGASAVVVRLAVEGAAMVLIVDDDGRGLSAERVQDAASLGLLGMRERARMLGGDVEFGAAPGRGTRVRAWIPQATRGSARGHVT